MKLIELICSPWALPHAQLREILAIYDTHLRGEKIDVKGVEARLGHPLANEPIGYEVRQGVAVLTLEGVMAPKANLFMEISGGISTQLAAKQLRAAAADPLAPNGIVQVMDTPGGSVIGVSEFADEIARARQAKPVWTYSDGMLASAGYWAGSAAERVYISGDAVMTGSIGVLIAHRDVSEANKQLGLKITEISAGKYKTVGSPNEPLSKADREHLQARADYVYSNFVDAVAKHRGVDTEQVLERMAEGRVFIGRQGIEAGLVDGVATLDDLIADLASAGGRSRTTPRRAGVALAPATSSPGGQTMPPDVLTRADLERDHPQLLQQLQTTFRAEGAAAERERVTAVRAQSLPGHEALIEQLANDGRTTGPEAAAAVLAAERQVRAAAALAHTNDAPPAAPGSNAPASGEKDRATQAAEARAYANKNGVSFVAAMKQLGYEPA